MIKIDIYGKTQQSNEKTYGNPLNHDKSPMENS